MRITSLSPEGSDAAVALWHEVGLTRPLNDPHTDLQRALEGPTSTVLAALDGDRLVGTAMVGTDGHRGWLYYLAVAPDRQWQGIGRRLLEAAEGWAREGGMPKLLLMVRTDNEGVAAFYAGAGYEASAVRVLGRRLED